MTETPKSLYIGPLLLGIYVICYMIFGERTPVNQGLGWDGALYAKFASRLAATLSDGLAPYYATRILPSVVVGFVSTALGLDLTRPDTIVSAFQAYNAVLQSACALVWLRIASRLTLDVSVAALGGILLFVSWACLKQWWYFGVQTDVTAYFLGSLVALFAIERRLVALSVVALVASFCWQSVLVFCAPLVLFPHPVSLRTGPASARWFPISLAVCAMGLGLYYTLGTNYRLLHGAAQVSVVVLPISLAVLGFYVHRVASGLNSFDFGAARTLPGISSTLAFAAVIVLHLALKNALLAGFGNNQEVLSFTTMLSGTFLSSLAKPGVFLVAHLVFFGPALLIALANIRKFHAAAASISLGTCIFCLLTFMLALNSESRVLSFCYPMIVCIVCASLREVRLSSRTLAAAACSCLVVSKAYLPVTRLGFELGPPGQSWLSFPYQWFWMNNGPWMGWSGYFANLGFIALAAMVGLLVGRTGGGTGRTVSSSYETSNLGSR